MAHPRLSHSVRVHIRRRKAEIRKSVTDAEKADQLIRELYRQRDKKSTAGKGK